jgi:hypothetical protein
MKPRYLKKSPTAMGLRIVLVGVTLLLALCVPCRATIVLYGLYDTGVDNSGASLAGGNVDPHYTQDNGNALVVNPPHPAWLDYNPANGPSRWVGTLQSEPTDASHTYVTTFTLPAAPATILLSGMAASDNDAMIYLNGVQIGSVAWQDGNGYSFSHYDAFSTANASLFLAGQNELKVVVHNGYIPPSGPGGPYGLRLDNLDITTFTAVPEPATVLAGALLLLPFGVSTLRLMRKSRKT